MTVYGPLPSVAVVDEAVVDTLRKWMPSVLADVAAQAGRPTPAMVREIIVSAGPQAFPAVSPPFILVISPGLAADPVRGGDGRVSGTYAIGVMAVVSGRDERETRALAGVYTAAVRGVLMQNRRLGGAVRAVEWVTERYDERYDPQDKRVWQSGLVNVRVTVDCVVDINAGLPEPVFGARPEDPVVVAHEETIEVQGVA